MDNAVALLWASGQDSLLSLELKKIGNALAIPFQKTLLMMGITEDLEAELRRVKARRFEAITVDTPPKEEPIIIPMGARKWTKDPMDMGAPRKLSVIAIHGGDGGDDRFDKSWTWILPKTMITPPISIDELIKELPELRKL
jgi:hypothetical protein